MALPTSLTGLESIVVELLSQGLTTSEISTRLHRPLALIEHQRRKPHVQEAVFERQRSYYDHSGGDNMRLLPEIISTLRSIMLSAGTRDADKIQACRTLLTSANEYQLRRLMEHQIRTLEQKLYNVSNTPPPALDPAEPSTDMEVFEDAPSAGPFPPLDFDPEDIYESLEESSDIDVAAIRDIMEASKNAEVVEVEVEVEVPPEEDIDDERYALALYSLLRSK